tara:strand:- start:44 stop:895 length:852 start_codon:yes stop_codon:yes gene_type:complete
MSISLVYLCRGKDAGVDAAEKFIHYYSKYKSGCDHDLVVIFKGWNKSQIKDKENLKVKFLNLSANFIELEDDGFDWAAFMRVTPMLKTDFVCYLNTFSRPLCNFWLKNMYDCIKIKDVGVCGATASYKAWRFTFPYFEFKLSLIISYPFKIIRRLTNHFLLLGYYPNQYCPHLRSNGFSVERKIFLDFIKTKKIPTGKRDCYKLESGNSSLSNYVMNLNKRLMLIDKNGCKYDVQDWISSKTYCCPGQPELCIADNNTDYYDKQSVSNKKQMEYDAWGKIIRD